MHFTPRNFANLLSKRTAKAMKQHRETGGTKSPEKEATQQQDADSSPYTLEREVDGRYRVMTREGHIGTIFGFAGHWLTEINGQTDGPFETCDAAVLAVYLQRSLLHLME